jgi:restriction endonuclease S subunit
LAALRLLCGSSTNFLLNLMRALQTSLEAFASGTTFPAVSKKDVEELTIPIPPLDEQHRIVAKVDELMALCDTLKARLSDAQITQVHLADTIVEQAVT